MRVLRGTIVALPRVRTVVAWEGHRGDQPGTKGYRGRPETHAIQRNATRRVGNKKSRQDHRPAAQLSRQRSSGTGHDSGVGHAIWDVSQAAVRCLLDD